MDTRTIKSRLTMKEVAIELRHSYSWVHANHRSIGLKGYRIGGRWYFDQSDLDAWGQNLKGHSNPNIGNTNKRKVMPGKVIFV
jgi:hypothetical protein